MKKKKSKLPRSDQGSTASPQSSRVAQHYHQHSYQHHESNVLSELHTELHKLESFKGLINHTKRAEILSKIGKVYYSSKNISKALEAHNEAMDIYRGIYGEEDILVANTLRDIGDVYCEAKNLSVAVDNYMDALKLIRSIQGDRDEFNIDIARLLVKVGNIAYKQNDLEVALPSFLLASKTFQVSPECIKEHIDLLEKIGKLYCYDQSQYKEAFDFYQQAMVVRKSIIGEHKTNQILSLEEEIAIVYLKLGYVEKSLAMLKGVLKENEIKYGKRSTQVATTLVSLGNVYEQRDDYDKAMDLLLRALSIQKEHLPNNDEGNIILGITLNNIGNVHKRKGEMRYAMSAYTDALELKEKCMDKHLFAKREIAYTLVSIGIVHEFNDNLDEAMQLFEEARSLQETVLNESHLDLSRTINYIAVVFGKLRRYEDAMENHLEVLRIYNEVLGPEHPDISDTLCYIGEIHRKWKEYDQALGVLNEAQRIAEADTMRKPAKLSLTLASIMHETGLVHEEMGSEEEAIQSYKSSLDNYRASGVDGTYPGVKLVISNLSKLDNSFGTLVDTALSWAGILAPDINCVGGGAALEAMSCMTSDMCSSYNNNNNNNNEIDTTGKVSLKKNYI